MLPIQANSKTMSSREISEFTGKEHGHVLRDIRSMISELKQDDPRMDDPQEEKDSRGYTSCIYLNRELTDTLLTGYSAVARRRVIKRWQELESGQHKIPTTLSSALRLAAEQAEQIEALTLKAQNDAPKVEFAEAVRRMEGACKIGDFGKTIGYGRTTFFAMLKADKVLMPDRMPYQRYIDAGYLVVVEQLPYTDSKGVTHPAFTTMVTGKGQVWLERKYRQAEAA